MTATAGAFFEWMQPLQTIAGSLKNSDCFSVAENRRFPDKKEKGLSFDSPFTGFSVFLEKPFCLTQKCKLLFSKQKLPQMGLCSPVCGSFFLSAFCLSSFFSNPGNPCILRPQSRKCRHGNASGNPAPSAVRSTPCHRSVRDHDSPQCRRLPQNPPAEEW